jgi:hypothetical protein
VNAPTRQLRLTTDQLVSIPESDYPEVAHELVTYLQARFAAFSNELHEFLEQREDAAPTTVDRARVLDSILGYEVRRWLKHITEQ